MHYPSESFPERNLDPHSLPAYSDMSKEREWRASDAALASIELGVVSASGLALGVIGETLQTARDVSVANEATVAAEFPDMSPDHIATLAGSHAHTHEIGNLVAAIPFDLKAVAVGAAVYGAVHAAGRIRRNDRFRTDLADIMKHPEDHDWTFGGRMKRRLARTAIAAVAVTGAYQAAKYGTQNEDLFVTAATDALALGSIPVSKFMAKRSLRRSLP